jgi:hypothetical protein
MIESSSQIEQDVNACIVKLTSFSSLEDENCESGDCSYTHG